MKKILGIIILAIFCATSNSQAEVRIIYEDDNGKMAVVTPAKKSKHDLDKVISKSVPPGKKYKIIDSSELPSNRKTRDNWRFDDYHDKGKDYGKAKFEMERKK